jgi:integrase
MKHPGDKKGNKVHCELPPEALAIIKAMPRYEQRIFQYSTDAISAAFTRACRFLGIEDLRFHDLRHEGISRLFEMGRTTPQVAAVSGHRSWTSLKRYAHIRQSKDSKIVYADVAGATSRVRCHAEGASDLHHHGPRQPALKIRARQ